MNVRTADPQTVDHSDATTSMQRYVNRELSWLGFNRRVLEESANVDHPLLERLRFLSISAANLDEFFMVRVSGLVEQHRAGLATRSDDGLTPSEQLTVIGEAVSSLTGEQQRLWRELHGELAAEKRKAILADYAAGDIRVVVNVAVLTEGWDHPPTSCVVLLRPSSYKSTMIQMVGRGLGTVGPEEHPGGRHRALGGHPDADPFRLGARGQGQAVAKTEIHRVAMDVPGLLRVVVLGAEEVLETGVLREGRGQRLDGRVCGAPREPDQSRKLQFHAVSFRSPLAAARPGSGARQ